jgi:hypothetical protein
MSKEVAHSRKKRERICAVHFCDYQDWYAFRQSCYENLFRLFSLIGALISAPFIVNEKASTYAQFSF